MISFNKLNKPMEKDHDQPPHPPKKGKEQFQQDCMLSTNS